MLFEFSPNSLDRISSDGVVVFVFEGKKGVVQTHDFTFLDGALNNLLSKTIKAENFEAKTGNFLTIYTQEKMLSPKVFIVGLGKKEEFTQNTLRRAVGSLA